MLETTDFRDFSITSWYELFKSITIRSILLKLPEAFTQEVASGNTSVDLQEVSPSFLDELRNALNSLNNSAFVKNNWHAPIDAKMFSFGNTLKVSSIDNILLLYQTSTILQEDFSTIQGVDFYLVLREWRNIHPAAEFRCIVINNVLHGITPRDWPTFYAHYKEEGPQIIDSISNFYDENIKLRFPRKNYVFDVVLSYPEAPYIVDFGPLNNKTQLYAFSWVEIQPLVSKKETEDIAPVFRYLESDIGIMTRSDQLRKIAQSTSTCT